MIDSPSAALRLDTRTSKRVKQADNPTAIMIRLVLGAETRFPRLEPGNRSETCFSVKISSSATEVQAKS